MINDPLHVAAEGPITQALSLEIAFERLPPLGSPEFIQFVQAAPAADLPPEILVRAFRQLPVGSDASTATLDRLFKKSGADWEYLRPLIACARRRSKRFSRDQYEDLLQDAISRMLAILPSPRGEFAETSWNAFCRRELSESWRSRYGRRGERYPPEDQPDPEREQEPVFPLDMPRWHGNTGECAVDAIEALARRVLAGFEDPFHRDLAEEAWFRNRAPRISGNGGTSEEHPLTAVFEGKSRHAIGRALRYINAQLAAALLVAPSLELGADARALLMTLKYKAK